jgi:hypothetical protein
MAIRNEHVQVGSLPNQLTPTRPLTPALLDSSGAQEDGGDAHRAAPAACIGTPPALGAGCGRRRCSLGGTQRPATGAYTGAGNRHEVAVVPAGSAILLSSAVPGPEPDYMPELVAGNDFIYWADVKSSPERLLALLLPKSIITTMTDDQKDFAVKNAFVAAMPISERTDGILLDNKVTLPPGVNDIPFEQVSVSMLIFQAVDDPREYQGGQEMARGFRPTSSLA